MKERLATLALCIILLLSMVSVLTAIAGTATEEEIEDAIERGVAYLAGQQNPYGGWGGKEDDIVANVFPSAITGLVLTKLQRRAYELGYQSPFDPDYPYSSNVTEGWEFIFSTDVTGNPLFTQKQTLSLQNHTSGASGTIDDPDTNGNSYGICFGRMGVYCTGIILMALQASGTPDRANDGGKDYDEDGFADTFRQIAQDAADWLAWAQGDSGNDEGGWGYGALDNQIGWNGWTDNSNSGYAVLGLAAAEGFGCSVPAWVRTELNVWITTIQDPVNGDTNDGGSYYNPDFVLSKPLCNELKGGNLIFQMTFYGDNLGVQRFRDAINYIVRHWQDYNTEPGWKGDKGFDDDDDGMIDEDPQNWADDDGDGMIDEDQGGNANYQAMFCLMKGFEYSGIDLIDLDSDGILEHDWYDEFATVLVNQQNPDGSWFVPMYVPLETLHTAWALLTLEKVTPPPPKITVYADIKPGSWPNPINIGSGGVFAVAICGTEDFDVMTINTSTVKIHIEGVEEGVSPILWSFEDVATPYTGEPEGGHALGGDGYLDLVLHFDTQMVVTTLGLGRHIGETIPVIITGNLYEELGGTLVQGQDYVWVHEPSRSRARAPIEIP